MRGIVKNNDRIAGYIEQVDGQYVFTYDEDYFNDSDAFAISFSIPKTKQIHISQRLHPFFQGLLAEGDNKQIQCRTLGIAPEDDFTRLIKTGANTIGAISVIPQS